MKRLKRFGPAVPSGLDVGDVGYVAPRTTLTVAPPAPPVPAWMLAQVAAQGRPEAAQAAADTLNATVPAIVAGQLPPIVPGQSVVMPAIPEVLPPAPDIHKVLVPDLVNLPLPAPPPPPPTYREAVTDALSGSWLDRAPPLGIAAPSFPAEPAAGNYGPTAAGVSAALAQAARAAANEAAANPDTRPNAPMIMAAAPHLDSLPITVSVPATTMVRNSDGTVAEVPTTPALAQVHVESAAGLTASMTPAQQVMSAPTPAMQDAAIVAGPVHPITAAERAQPAQAGMGGAALFLLIGAGVWMAFGSKRKGRR